MKRRSGGSSLGGLSQRCAGCERDEDGLDRRAGLMVDLGRRTSRKSDHLKDKSTTLQEMLTRNVLISHPKWLSSSSR